jgi:hypothetical protein
MTPSNYIQSQLSTLPGKSLFAETIRLNAYTDFDECVRMILSQVQDNRPLVTHIIGEDLLTKIEQL